jgi:hypothetical protein
MCMCVCKVINNIILMCVCVKILMCINMYVILPRYRAADVGQTPRHQFGVYLVHLGVMPFAGRGCLTNNRRVAVSISVYSRRIHCRALR